MSEFKPVDLKKYLQTPPEVLDKTDKTGFVSFVKPNLPVNAPKKQGEPQPSATPSPSADPEKRTRVSDLNPADTPNFQRAGNYQRAGNVSPAATLEHLRSLLDAGHLDGRHLVVLDCPHPDVGRVIREQFGHFDNAAAEGLNPGYFENRLKEIHRALESEAQA